MLPEISNAHLDEVAELVRVWQSTDYGRTAAIAPLAQRLSWHGGWLLSFFSYLLSSNRLWRSVDDGPYLCLTPAPTQRSTFWDLIELLRHYKGVALTAATEQRLGRFLAGCTTGNQELFLALLSRQKWLRELFAAEPVREAASRETINPEDVYGGTTLMTDGWYAVRYPVVITTVPDAELSPAIIYKSGRQVRIRKLVVANRNTGRSRRVTLPSAWLDSDRRFLAADSLVLYGLIAEERKEFYPLDCFSDLEEYKRHRKQPLVEFRERQQNLDRLLAVSYLRQIKKLPRVYCYGPSEVETAAGRALQNSPHTALLFCDGKGRTHTVTATLYEGVLDDLWQEAGQALGLHVWKNGRKLRCAFDFTGENNALLYNVRRLRGRHVLFAQFEYKGFRAGAVREILWDKRPYYLGQVRFLSGEWGKLEHCPICLRQDVRHIAKCGVCRHTYINWRSMMAAHGTNVWFTPSRKIRERRAETGWHPDLVNNLWMAFRGHRIVANDEGQLMFKSDPETMKFYERAKKDPRRYFNRKRKAEHPDELRQWYRQNYQIKGKEPTDDGSGTVRDVSGLHDQGALEAAGEPGDPRQPQGCDPDHHP